MNIVFIVVCEFPYGSASSMRARSLYKLIELAGHNVHVIADYESVSDADDCKDFSYESIFDKNISFKKRQTVPKKSITALKQYCKTHNVDCVLMNARYERVAKIAAFCKKQKIKLIVENCEWYDSSSFRLGKIDPRFYQNEIMMRYYLKRADGFISISRFLDKHNKEFGKKSVRIPTVLDVENTEYAVCTNNEKITIIYTGSVEKSKELLKPVIAVLAHLPDLRKKIEFHIYGPSRENVLNNIDGDEVLLEKAGQSVVIHGRIPQDKVQPVLKNADYLIFIRPVRRSSDAGFPTKLGESFAVGTPVIANDTGDLSLYIKNAENGFLLDSYSKEKLTDLFEKLINLSKEQYCNLRKGARKTAEESFDYRKYVETIENLLGDLR